MTRMLPALLLLGSVLTGTATQAAAEDRRSTLGVSVTVSSVCAVVSGVEGAVDVRCTRGGADRVLVASPEPRIVALSPDGSRLRGAVTPDQAHPPRFEGDALVTVQF